MPLIEAVALPLSPAGWLRGTRRFPEAATRCCSSTASARIAKAARPRPSAPPVPGAAGTSPPSTFAATENRRATFSKCCGSGLQSDLEAIRRCLAERGVERLFLVGSSMGGWASSWYACTHPGKAPAVVLIAPAFRFLHSPLGRRR